MQRLRSLCICGPSGAGKGTLIHKFILPDLGRKGLLGFSVSHTTRKPRAGEEDGKDYHFVSHQTFTDLADRKDFFAESTTVHGNFYGTSWGAIESVREAGKVCVLDIDIVAVTKIARKVDAHTVFLNPTNLKLLEERLRGRGTETEESLKVRLANAENEIRQAKELPVDLFLSADTTSIAYETLRPQLLNWYPQLC